MPSHSNKRSDGRRSQKITSGFPADRPIGSAKFDALGRKSFAKSLAARIGEWSGNDSLVISLYGEWGCGKTSLKNMVTEAIGQGDDRKVDLIEFNPWEVSGRTSLSSALFREIEIVLQGKSVTKGAGKDPVKRLQRYAKLAHFGSTLVKAAATVIPGAAMFADGLEKSGKMMESAAAAQDSIAKEKEQSLSALKAALSSDMRSLTRPILIVIDDIDRLTSDEIREVFQLVKANGDLPKFIYLLLFDRAIVSGALNEISGGRGNEFLDKIVQAPFHVPQPNIQDVHKMLFKGLDAHLGDQAVQKQWERSRWLRVWANLSTYFPNLRCVYRFLGCFDFHFKLLHDGKALELNPVDFIVIETLRLFEPTFYEGMVANRSILLGERVRLPYGVDKEKEAAEIESAIERMASSVPELRRARIRALLRELFPLMEGHHMDSALMLRQLRVAHRAIFHRYFSMALTAEELTQAELDSLLSNIQNSRGFSMAIRKLQRNGKLIAAFDRLLEGRESLPLDVFPAAITTLSDVGDALPERTDTEFVAIAPIDVAAHVISTGIRDVSDQKQRFQFLHDGLSASSGVSLAVRLVAREKEVSNSEGFTRVTPEDWEALKGLAVDLIRKASADGRLRKLPDLRWVLHCWRDWTEESEVKNWVAGQTKSGTDALFILRTFLQTASSSSAEKTVYLRTINLAYLSQFAEIDTLERLTEGLDGSRLETANKRALNAFQQALKWRSEGKPADYRGDRWTDDHPLAEEA